MCFMGLVTTRISHFLAKDSSAVGTVEAKSGRIGHTSCSHCVASLLKAAEGVVGRRIVDVVDDRVRIKGWSPLPCLRQSLLRRARRHARSIFLLSQRVELQPETGYPGLWTTHKAPASPQEADCCPHDELRMECDERTLHVRGNSSCHLLCH